MRESRVAKLCLGTVQLGLEYGIQKNGKPDEKEAGHILRSAFEAGIKYLDTAIDYGNAEIIVGSFLSREKQYKERALVTTKVSKEAFDKALQSQYKEYIKHEIMNSLRRLSLDKLEAVLFHDASCIKDEKKIDALVALKEEGLTEHIGVSVYYPEEALEAISLGVFDELQTPYNVFDYRWEEARCFEKAKEQRMTVSTRSSLLQGLAVMEPYALPKSMSFAKPYVEKFQNICREYNQKPLDIAITYALDNCNVDRVIFGVDNVHQLSEYVNASHTEITAQLLDDIKETFRNCEERLVNPSLW